MSEGFRDGMRDGARDGRVDGEVDGFSDEGFGEGALDSVSDVDSSGSGADDGFDDDDDDDDGDCEGSGRVAEDGADGARDDCWVGVEEDSALVSPLVRGEAADGAEDGPSVDSSEVDNGSGGGKPA